MRKFSSWRLVLPVLIAALVVVLTFAFAGAAAPGPSLQANASGVVPHNPTGILYDQTDNASGNGAPAQDFEAAYNVYDNEGADDFVVPANTQWNIDGVVIIGTQSTGGTPASVDVTFYADSATFPAASPTCTYSNVATFTGNTTINVTLPSACVLGPGNYWMAFSVNQNFGGGGGQYFWSNRTTQNNNGGVWRNPGNGFGTGCVNWNRQTTCGVGGGTSPDFLFQISGTAGPLLAPAIVMTKTVGTDPGSCATTSNISVGYGSTVYYCYTVENTGNVTLTHHTVTDDVLGTVLGPNYAHDLAPGATYFVTSSYVLTGTGVTNNALWEAFVIDTSIIATATGSATVTGTPTDVTLTDLGGQTTNTGIWLAAATVIIVLMGAALYLRRQHS
jgi:hypothetical protein